MGESLVHKKINVENQDKTTTMLFQCFTDATPLEDYNFANNQVVIAKDNQVIRNPRNIKNPIL